MKHKEWRRGDGLEMVILSLSLAGLVCVLSLVAQTLDDYKLASSPASPNFNTPVQKIQSLLLSVKIKASMSTVSQTASSFNCEEQHNSLYS